MSILYYYIRDYISDEDKKIMIHNLDCNMRRYITHTPNQTSVYEPQYSQTYNSEYSLSSISGPEFTISNFS